MDTFNKPNEIIKVFNKGKDNLFKVTGSACALTEKQVGIKNVNKPEAVKIFLKINKDKLPETEDNLRIKEIEKQLIKHEGYNIVILNKYEYYVEVVKSKLFINYLLYNPEEYWKYKERMAKKLKERCKEINDAEYLELIIELNRWKRKESNSESKKMIEYLNEIKGKFDVWYLENGTNTPRFDKMILQLREKIKELVCKILRAKSEIKNLNIDKEKMENQFDNDITNFPANLKIQIERNEFEIITREKIIKKIEKELWGTFEGKEEGLIWKHERLEREYKKIRLGDDKKFEEFSEKSTKKNIDEIKLRIKRVLEENEIQVDDNEMSELLLEVLSIRLDDEDKFYEEIINDEKAEENLAAEINKVLNKKYNIKEKPVQTTEYPTFNFNFDDIKKYAAELPDELRYKYYVRIDIEIKRVLNAFELTELKRFDGNIYFGLKEYTESINYILNIEKCPELNLIVEKRIKTLNENPQEKDFKLNIFVIEGDIILETNRIYKVRELVNYEIEYLEKILGIKKDKKREEKEKSDESIEIKSLEQDTFIEKFQQECVRRKLVKGKTIPNLILYEITKAIGIKVGAYDTFKSGDKAYHEVREFASRFGYKRKKPTER